MQFDIVPTAFRVRLVSAADWLFGCSHRKTTFPRTPAAVKGRPGTREGTYIVCLDCGRQFAYDWTTMRVTSPGALRVATPALLPALGEARRGSR
jgi:hypothetical protein